MRQAVALGVAGGTGSGKTTGAGRGSSRRPAPRSVHDPLSDHPEAATLGEVDTGKIVYRGRRQAARYHFAASSPAQDPEPQKSDFLLLRLAAAGA